MDLKFPKKSKKKKVPKKGKMHIPEKANQCYADDYLSTLNIPNLRIVDELWSRLSWKDTVAKGMLANGSRRNNGARGLADNTCFTEICSYFSLGLHLEQKSTTGLMTGAQKDKARVLPYRIAKTPEDTTRIVQHYVKCVRKLKKFLEENPDFFEID